MFRSRNRSPPVVWASFGQAACPLERETSRSPFALRLVAAAWPLALGLAACGGKAAPPAIAPASSASAGAAPATSTARSTEPPGPPPAPAPPGPAIAPPAPPPTAGSTKVTVRSDPTWASCHQGYEAKKDPARDVDAMARGCAKVTKMSLFGTTLTGKQGDQDPPQSFPFKADAGRCYRVYAQASEGIKDLDLAIKDSSGAIAGEDSTDDASPVVVEDGAVCFKEADGAAVVVSVGMGKGTYAVQIWKD
jgi:hypothetical protein